MQVFDSFSCYQCSNTPTDFVVLVCNHVLCGECMAGYQSNLPLVTLPCYCGITTNFSTYQKSQKMNLSKVSCMPALAKGKNEILNQSCFAINEQSTFDNLSKVNKPSCLIEQQIRKQTGNKSVTHYLRGELSNEIKFMEIRFKRYMNEISRSYSRLVVNLNNMYSEMIKLISDKFTLLIETNKIKSLAAIQTGTIKIFKSTLEKKLIKLSKQLSSFNKTSLSSDIQSIGKENINLAANQSLLKSKSTRKSSHENCKKENFMISINSMNLFKAGLKQQKIRKKKMVGKDRYFGGHFPL